MYENRASLPEKRMAVVVLGPPFTLMTSVHASSAEIEDGALQYACVRVAGRVVGTEQRGGEDMPPWV